MRTGVKLRHEIASGVLPLLDEFLDRVLEGEGDARKGAILAAYDGQHGWFWLNIADGPATVTLNVAGFYSEIIKIDAEGY